MAEYMAKEKAESSQQQKAHLAKAKEFAGEMRKIQDETASRIKDFEAANRAFEEKLGKELE